MVAAGGNTSQAAFEKISIETSEARPALNGLSQPDRTVAETRRGSINLHHTRSVGSCQLQMRIFPTVLH